MFITIFSSCIRLFVSVRTEISSQILPERQQRGDKGVLGQVLANGRLPRAGARHASARDQLCTRTVCDTLVPYYVLT